MAREPDYKGPTIRAERIWKSFGGKEVLRGFDIEVQPGEILVVIGISGCGKSTLLRALVGAYGVDAGRIFLFGKELTDADEEAWGEARRRIGILYQAGALYTSMTVGENVGLPLVEHTDLAPEVIDVRVRTKLELVGLAGVESHMPAELSGGMQKRAALARAMALDPELIFYDEPTTGLDPIMAGIVNSLINDFNRKLGVTTLVITQDMNCCYAVAHRVVLIHEGRAHFQGTVEELKTSTDPVVSQFIEGRPEGPVVHRAILAG